MKQYIDEEQFLELSDYYKQRFLCEFYELNIDTTKILKIEKSEKSLQWWISWESYDNKDGYERQVDGEFSVNIKEICKNMFTMGQMTEFLSDYGDVNVSAIRCNFNGEENIRRYEVEVKPFNDIIGYNNLRHTIRCDAIWFAMKDALVYLERSMRDVTNND